MKKLMVLLDAIDRYGVWADGPRDSSACSLQMVSLSLNRSTYQEEADGIR